MLFCNYQREGCLWRGLTVSELESHLNLENLSKDNWLDECEYPNIECIFCRDENLKRKEYIEKLNATNLTEKDLLNALNTTWSAKHQWYNIGLNLGIDCSTLDVIHLEERDKAEDCLRRVLLCWLRSAGEKSWAVLQEAVRDFKVGYVSVAEDILITATCKKGKKIIQEKYTKEAETKTKKIDELKNEARKLAQQYREKREDVLNKEAQLSSWQTRLDEHENEFTDLSKRQGILWQEEELILMSDKLRRCQEEIKKCKEKVLKLEEDIAEGKQGLKDITDAIADCNTQIKITLDELNRCKEILLKSNEGFENERQKNIQEKGKRRTAEVVIGGAGTYLIGCTMIALSPLTGPLAPAVAATGGAMAVSGWRAAAASENLNEDQKKIYSEYKDTSSKCERTLEQVEEIAAETNTEIENLNQLVLDFRKLKLTS